MSLPNILSATILYSLLSHAYATEKSPTLGIPIACTIGTDCFIQNYVDADPSEKHSDYQCGFLSYDNHKGTDFRLKTSQGLETGVPVLAAADGVVRAIRDGMDDINVRVIGRDALQGKDAGNSVVIVHGNNWESQYGHLKKGSVAVEPGQKVSRGTVLGQVGLSGNTEFVHLHFEIRHQGKPVDPFIGVNGGKTCGLGKKPLWGTETLNKIPYIATDILTAGFTDRPPANKDEEPTETSVLPTDAENLVFSITLFGVQAGDEQVIDWLTPDGKEFLHKTGVIDRNMAQSRSFWGKKRQQESWPQGNYQVHYQLLRKQKPLLNKNFVLQIP